MKFKIILFLLSILVCRVSGETKTIELKFIETSDIHGNYLPYNYIEQRDWNGSLSRIHTYVQKERLKYGHNLLLLDNGDILEGQPTAYYYNYVDTASTHLCADIMNYMQYDAANLGNHDIETGNSVFERWIRDCDFPVLGANIVREKDGRVFTKPYEVFEREGLRIVVLGMTTPVIPVWVCKTLWQGLEFLDMEASTRYWMDIIREKEKPDVVIGLFHSGKDARTLGGKYREDASLEIAERVPGFDVVMIGHDHSLYCEKIVNMKGDSVLVVNPGCDGIALADVRMSVTVKNGKVIKKRVQGELVDADSYIPDRDLLKRYKPQHEEVNAFLLQKIGVFTETITTRPAYFGPSAFVDFIHSLQLRMSNADISFASPLSFDTRIEGGDIRICDMFNLYKYKNLIYTMRLTGKEVKDYLEESYSIWTNQMKSPDDHLLLFNQDQQSDHLFAHYFFYFDSAAGIYYTVDVSKPKGEKVTILSMADGTPFGMNENYRVAMTSYRGNGGGELLTRGAGLSLDELDSRILTTSKHDFRYFLIEYIKENKVIHPRMLNHWKFIPEDWVRGATERDYRILFDDSY